jgi:hypothetical protein
MQEWILKYWIQVIFGLITAGLIAGYKKLARNISVKFKEQDAIKLGIQVLLRDRIVQCYNHYMEKGFCPIYAMDNINALYSQYHALGGNGTITELVERLRDMPTEIKEIKNKI